MAKAVKKKESTEVSVDVSDMFEMDAGSGLQDMGIDDLAIPFFRIVAQGNELLELDENLRLGDLYNTATRTTYVGKTGVEVIPCAYQRRFIEWMPRGEGKGKGPMNIYLPDEERPKTERNPDDNKDYVVGGDGQYIEDTRQHFVLVVDDEGHTTAALISMTSTQLKKSKKWNSMMQSVQMTGKNGPFSPPRYSQIYLMRTVPEKNNKGTWHGWEMSRVGPIQDVGLYKRAKEFAESIESGDVTAKYEQEQTEATKDVF